MQGCGCLAVRFNDEAGSSRSRKRSTGVSPTPLMHVHGCRWVPLNPSRHSMTQEATIRIYIHASVLAGQVPHHLLAKLVGRARGQTPVNHTLHTFHTIPSQHAAKHEQRAATDPIFSSRESLETRSFTRSATVSVGSQNGNPADMLPGKQPHACPLGRFEPGSATAARSRMDNMVALAPMCGNPNDHDLT
jgi:hypothetical protein